MVVVRIPLCRRNYRKFVSVKLENKAEDVKAGVYENTNVFTTTPITLVVVAALITDYSEKRKAFEHGGIDQKLPYENAIKAIVNMLDKLADYVDSVALGNVTIIKTGGYEVAWDNSEALAKNVSGAVAFIVEGVSLKRVENAPGRMVSDCDPKHGATTFIAILTEGVPLTEGTTVDSDFNVCIPGSFTAPVRINVSHQRKKYWNGLVNSVNYYVYYMAVTAKTASLLSVAVKAQCF